MIWLVILAVSVATMSPLRRPAIGVFLDFDAVPTAQSVLEMKKEAAKIMGSSGYSLDWRALKENRGTEAFANVMVLRFRGRCQAGRLTLRDPAPHDAALASTLVREGHVLPFGEVQCDEVRRGLSYAAPPDRPKALGMALGRVVAHELYHVVAGTTRHASSGLAAATHDWLELMGGVSGFRKTDLPVADER